MRTELVWEGKYDEYGQRRKVDVAGASFPMQKIETVDRSPGSEALSSGQTTLEVQLSVQVDHRSHLL
jgi:adenine-specific DNA-methyltransferase